MFKKGMIGLIVATFVLMAGCSKSAEAPDLNKVLDVFSTSIDFFQSSADVETGKDADDAVMNEFSQYTEENLNAAGFSKVPLGLDVQTDGSFLGYHDANQNSAQDAGEDKLFTVEMDTERSRLIATDVSGSSTETHFSGTGFLAGALIGNLLSRQRMSGVSSSSLSSRKTMGRTQYSSARSRSFSGSHSSGK